MQNTVFIFSFAYDPLWGGAEIAVAQIARRLPHYQFVIFTHRFSRAHARQEIGGNVKIIRIFSPHRALYPFLAALSAFNYSRRTPPLFCWAIMANYAGFAALFFSFFRPRIPYVLSLQEGDDLKKIERKISLVSPMFALIFTRAAAIHAISGHLKHFAQRWGRGAAVEVIPNGVDETFFVKELKWPRHNRQKMVLITVSRLVEKNAVDDIIRALALLPPYFILRVAGEGSEKDFLKKLAQKKNVFTRVIFDGHVEYRDLPAYLTEGDIFVRPSRSEGLGNAFLEAMAAGLPVVGTREGGIADFLFDKKTGVVCQANNPESISYAVSWIAAREHEQEVRYMLNKAYKMVQDQFSWNSIAERMDQFFVKVMQDK